MRLGILTFVLVTIALTSYAQVFVKQNATGTNDGTSWTNAFTDLQAALDAAGQGDQLWIAAGTYLPQGLTPESSHFLLQKPMEIYGGFSGSESSIDQRDWQANPTILSGDNNGDDVEGDFFNLRTDNAHHIFIVDAGSTETILDGLTFISGTTRLDGFAPDSSDILGYDRWRGGALYIRNTLATIRNCSFQDNHGYQGAGLFSRDDNSTTNNLTIENTQFIGNSTLNAGACSIRNLKECLITECVFQQNLSGGSGGGLLNGNSNMVIQNTSFDQNFASNIAGACFIFNNAASLIPFPSFYFKGCHFTRNEVGGAGGALQLNNFASGFDLTFDSCTFTQNIAPGPSGGAIYVSEYYDVDSNETSSRIKIIHTTFTENSSFYGGAIEIDAQDDSLQIDIQHSGFFNNSTDPTSNGGGGGLYIWNVGDAIVHAQIENTVFDGNEAPYGAAVILDNYYNTHRLTYVIDSCIFSNNIADQYGGAKAGFVNAGIAPIGSILNSKFINNQSTGMAGAIYSEGETLLIENCLFSENYTQGTFNSEYNGGGAILLDYAENAVIRNTIFETNISDNDGSAVWISEGSLTRFENVLFNNNEGNNTVSNKGYLELVNASMVDNDFGLFATGNSITEIQNSIFRNAPDNLMSAGFAEIFSKGGNISSDGTMSAFLTGSGPYEDLHNTDPMLDAGYVPVSGSPCIDAGNPEGIVSPVDLAGNPRVYGGAIDIGTYESFLVATHDAVWDSQAFTIFPNPVKESLIFELENEWTGEFSFCIYNFLGQQVVQADMVKTGRVQNFQLDVNSMTAGEYVVLAIMGDKTYVAKLIIQR